MHDLIPKFRKDQPPFFKCLSVGSRTKCLFFIISHCDFKISVKLISYMKFNYTIQVNFCVIKIQFCEIINAKCTSQLFTFFPSIYQYYFRKSQLEDQSSTKKCHMVQFITNLLTAPNIFPLPIAIPVVLLQMDFTLPRLNKGFYSKTSLLIFSPFLLTVCYSYQCYIFFVIYLQVLSHIFSMFLLFLSILANKY